MRRMDAGVMAVAIAMTSCAAWGAAETGRKGAERPCFPGAYYRKAVSRVSEWSGIRGEVTLPEFRLDPERRDPKTSRALDNPSIYIGGQSGGQEIDAGLSYEIVREPDGKASRERKAFRPFWRNEGWASGPASPDYYYYPGDTVRMTCETTAPGTLGLEIVLVSRGEAGRMAVAAYGPAAHEPARPQDPVSTLTVTFRARGFAPGRRAEFKRVNAIDQVGREGKGVEVTGSEVVGAEWREVWLLRTGEKIAFTPDRFDDMRCPDPKHFEVSPGGVPGHGGEKVTIRGARNTPR